MKEAAIEKKVKEALNRVTGNKDAAITIESKLIEDVGLDSFSSLELIFELEDVLKIQIATEDARDFITVGDVLDYIDQCVKQQTGAKYAN